MNTRIEKFEVCSSCHSIGITDPNCSCVTGDYKTIELEFEVCKCCGNIIEDGYPAVTSFNYDKLSEATK